MEVEQFYTQDGKAFDHSCMHICRPFCHGGSPRTTRELAVQRARVIIIIIIIIITWLLGEVADPHQPQPASLAEVVLPPPKPLIAIERRAACLQDPRHDECAKECEVNCIELYMGNNDQRFKQKRPNDTRGA